MTAVEPTSQRAKVLLVDDDERNLLALSEVLDPIAEVVCVNSGRNALRALLRDEFAVILLDVFMPDLDGYETAALVREREQTARIPIIFLSAVNKETEHLMRGYEMGAVDYVFKPVDAIVLKSKVSVFVDLFDMRRQLEDSEKRQASILRALPMAIYEITERDGERLQQFRGGDLSHFLGDEAGALIRGEKKWLDYVHPDDLAHLASGQDDARDAVTAEYRWLGPQGQRHHILDHRTQVPSAPGTRRWVGSLLDITDRKELEAQLVHSGKLDALGQLTGGIAHDFNNLLAAIVGGVGILERRLQLGEREATVINHMRHAAMQGTELVRRMMAFARQQDLTPTSIDPVSLCDTVAGLVSHTLGGTITLDWECPDEGMYLYVDRGQLELALMNLIINARDAMPDGGVIRVAIAGRPTDGGKPLLAISVSDTGAGMPPEVLKRVTEPFFTTKETGKGTGLGLSMVSGFARQSGGDLKIESVVGEGTRVELLLPATDVGSSEEGRTKGESLFWLDGKRMMLIDDDDSVRAILAEQFRDAGADVSEFPSGEAAIAALGSSQSPYDLVLCDFAMPGRNGVETLREIEKTHPDIGYALMTGNVEDTKLSSDHGFTVIRKPLTARGLSHAFVR